MITPVATISYPHVDNPQPGPPPKPGEAPKPGKYSAAFLFAHGTDLSELKAAAIEAARTKFGASIKTANGTIVPIEKAFDLDLLKSPFRTDALRKGYPEGTVYINARSDQKPGAAYAYAGTDGKPALVPAEKIKDEFYAGAQVRASVTAFGYDREGNKGVSFALNNIQKIADGERIDGRVAAENEFTADLSQAPADLASLE